MASCIFGRNIYYGLFAAHQEVKKAKKKIAELENEMVASHAEILELQKEKLMLEEKLKAPVILSGEKAVKYMM